MEVFKELEKRASFSRTEVKKLASAIGWQGCYGFNRLIHHHTDVAELFVIKNSQDVSYSGKHYATEEVRYSDWDASYCPDCVKEDLESFGFSYWKRFCNLHRHLYRGRSHRLCCCDQIAEPVLASRATYLLESTSPESSRRWF